MSDDHVRMKVKEALAATDNNRHDAQKLLITWAVRDPVLLLGMTKPHLKGIAASLIEHTARTPDKARIILNDEGPDHIAAGDIMTPRGPLEKRRKPAVPPPKSTERQASTMRKLAAAFTKKKD